MQKLPPLPLDFYDSKAWHETILDFYGSNPKFPSKDILNAPIALLTKAVGNVVDIYGDFTSTNLRLFKQTVNPLYDINEYEKMVYTVIKSAAVQDSQPKFNTLADSLLIIRYLFAKNSAFINKKFSNEISKINKPTDGEKMDFFLETMRTITKTHINQIVKIIEL